MNTRLSDVKKRLEHLSHLVFDIVRTDIGWHSFDVVWSDDGGTTKIETSFDLDEFDRQLLSFPEATVLACLEEVRHELTSA